MARIRIGDLMVRAGLIDEMQLQSALSYQRQWGGRLGDILVNQGYLDEMMLWRGLSRQLDVPLVCLPEIPFLPDVVTLVPQETAERLELFPITRDERTLTVATSEPNNIGAVDEVAFRSGLKVKTVLAPAREIDWAIRTFYRGARDPCPPPRTRAHLEIQAAAPAHEPTLDSTVPIAAGDPAGGFEHTHTPLQELAATRPAGGNGFSVPPTQSGAPSAGGVVDEQLHRQTVDTLRAVIELCIARGVFTRDELWQVLQNHAQAPGQPQRR
jgi:Type II secretion system (T2SS), protein E, N-terminal domain